MLGPLRNIKLRKAKGLSESANAFDTYLRKEETWRSAGTYIPTIRMSYDSTDVDRMRKNYISRLTKGTTTEFDLGVVREYIAWAEDKAEVKTLITFGASHIDRINQLQRAIAYHNALITII